MSDYSDRMPYPYVCVPQAECAPRADETFSELMERTGPCADADTAGAKTFTAEQMLSYAKVYHQIRIERREALTDEQIAKIWAEHGAKGNAYTFARAILAANKEKP